MKNVNLLGNINNKDLQRYQINKLLSVIYFCTSSSLEFKDI